MPPAPSMPLGDDGSAGLVFDIQRFSLFDGPGIRTTVFLKGCPLRCPWCHNPEGVTTHPELLYRPDLCVRCGACVAVCPKCAHRIGADGIHSLDRDVCAVCGACAEVCPSRALELCGQLLSVDDVMAVVIRDAGYYADTGGGLTLSGGEPLLQPGFATALLLAAKRKGYHTSVETCGCADWARLEAIQPLTDLFLFDLKETDPRRHRAAIGAALEPILNNLTRLVVSGAQVVLRLPLIPGYNDRRDHIEAVARLARELPGLVGADLLPYHRLGEGKRPTLGQPDPPVSQTPEAEHVQAWKAQFAAAGLRVRVAGDM